LNISLAITSSLFRRKTMKTQILSAAALTSSRKEPNMTTWLPRWFACLVFVLSFIPVVAADPDDAEIARLVKQLGDDDFDKREAATARLIEIGDPALEALRKAVTSKDAEVHRRAEDVVTVLETKLYGEQLCLTGHTARVMGVAFSPDGRRLLSASNDGTVRLIDVSTRKLIHTLAHPCARSVAFSPDGKKAVSTGDQHDQTVRLWDLETGKELKRFAGYRSPISGVTFSADGKRVLFGVFSDKTMRLLDVESGKEIQRFEGHTEGVHGIALSADGKRSLSGSYDSTVRLWDNETGKELKRLEGHKGAVAAVAFSPDGKRAVAGGGGDYAIKLWDLETGKEIRRMEAPARVHALAFSKDGRRIASANYEGHTVSLWDAETGKELHRFAGHTSDVYDVAFSADGRFLVSGGEDNTVRVWRVPR
jgi:WD40 repeat protein